MSLDVNSWKPTSELFGKLAETDDSFQPTENERICIEDVLGRIVPPGLIADLVTARANANYMGACSKIQAFLVGWDGFESTVPASVQRAAQLIVGTGSCW